MSFIGKTLLNIKSIPKVSHNQSIVEYVSDVNMEKCATDLFYKNYKNIMYRYIYHILFYRIFKCVRYNEATLIYTINNVNFFFIIQ